MLLYLVLALLSTRPEYQRRGVGSALVKHGINLQDLRDRPLWLEASTMGYPLYKKLGFEDVEEHITDFTPYGLEHKAKGVGMLRRPGTSTDAAPGVGSGSIA